MNLSETQKGDWAILSNELLWSFFPVITILSYAYLTPITSLAWSTLFACLFFGVLMLVKGKAHELRKTEIYKPILVIAFLIGWLYYGFYFTGLKFTTAGNASIIAQTEVLFSYLLFNVWHKEYFSARHGWGAALMLLGAAIILFPKNGAALHFGDWLVLIATACAPMGNYYQQILRKKISSETLLFLRSLLTFPFFFLVAVFLKQDAGLGVLQKTFWLLLFNGTVVIGLSKILWIEGIHRISVTKASALGTISPLFTLFFAYLFLHQPPTIWQLSAFIPMAAGLILLTYSKRSTA